ncbi:MAG TPA: dTMP kinase [Methyloceanibacter sp.]
MRHENIEAGKFITLEGGEGAGKSTQSTILVNRLLRAGRRVVATREPGGSPLGEEIREALLSGRIWQLGPVAEAVLFGVARADHIDHTIVGALEQGKWVICDRYIDSTRAYQGATSGVSKPVIGALERLTTGGLKPDLTIILDIPPKAGLARANERLGDETPDRFERQELVMHERIRQAFLDIAEEEPERCVVIDADHPEAHVAEDVWEAVTERLHP